MLNKRTIIKQRTQSAMWVRLIIAFSIAAFAIIFIPFSYNSVLLWFGGLSVLSYMLIHWTTGFRSWILKDGEGKHTLCIRDNHSKCNFYIPFEYITHAELCKYTLWKDSTPAAYTNQPFHRTYTHFGYQGVGLIVCYILPACVGGDSQLHSWQIPGVKAEEFLEVLKENIRSLQ